MNNRVLKFHDCPEETVLSTQSPVYGSVLLLTVVLSTLTARAVSAVHTAPKSRGAGPQGRAVDPATEHMQGTMEHYQYPCDCKDRGRGE